MPINMLRIKSLYVFLQIMLGEVLSTSKAVLEGGVTRQICSLRCSVTPPPPSHHHTLHLNLGHINVVLVLEDHGPIGQLKDGTTLASTNVIQPLPITTANQYLPSSAETVPTWSSHVAPHDVPQFVPGINFGQYAAPKSQTFDPHLGALPPPLQPSLQHPRDTNVPITGIYVQVNRGGYYYLMSSMHGSWCSSWKCKESSSFL